MIGDILTERSRFQVGVGADESPQRLKVHTRSTGKAGILRGGAGPLSRWIRRSRAADLSDSCLLGSSAAG